MNVNLGIWDKLTKFVVFLIVAAALLGVFYKYLPLIKENQRYRRAILATEAQLAAEERMTKQLRASIDALQNDPRTIERLARERHGLARTNEMIIRFEQPARR